MYLRASTFLGQWFHVTVEASLCTVEATELPSNTLEIW